MKLPRKINDTNDAVYYINKKKENKKSTSTRNGKKVKVTELITKAKFIINRK